jgi:hypothetical protein
MSGSQRNRLDRTRRQIPAREKTTKFPGVMDSLASAAADGPLASFMQGDHGHESLAHIAEGNDVTRERRNAKHRGRAEVADKRPVQRDRSPSPNSDFSFTEEDDEKWYTKSSRKTLSKASRKTFRDDDSAWTPSGSKHLENTRTSLTPARKSSRPSGAGSPAKMPSSAATRNTRQVAPIGPDAHAVGSLTDDGTTGAVTRAEQPAENWTGTKKAKRSSTPDSRIMIEQADPSRLLSFEARPTQADVSRERPSARQHISRMAWDAPLLPDESSTKTSKLGEASVFVHQTTLHTGKVSPDVGEVESDNVHHDQSRLMQDDEAARPVCPSETQVAHGAPETSTKAGEEKGDDPP